MANEIEIRKKMLKELMGQMDDRMAQRAMMGNESPRMERMEGDRGNMSMMDMAGHEASEAPMMESMEEDELMKRLKNASMK